MERARGRGGDGAGGDRRVRDRAPGGGRPSVPGRGPLPEPVRGVPRRRAGARPRDRGRPRRQRRRGRALRRRPRGPGRDQRPRVLAGAGPGRGGRRPAGGWRRPRAVRHGPGPARRDGRRPPDQRVRGRGRRPPRAALGQPRRDGAQAGRARPGPGAGLDRPAGDGRGQDHQRRRRDRRRGPDRVGQRGVHPDHRLHPRRPPRPQARHRAPGARHRPRDRGPAPRPDAGARAVLGRDPQLPQGRHAVLDLHRGHAPRRGRRDADRVHGHRDRRHRAPPGRGHAASLRGPVPAGDRDGGGGPVRLRRQGGRDVVHAPGPGRPRLRLRRAVHVRPVQRAHPPRRPAPRGRGHPGGHGPGRARAPRPRPPRGPARDRRRPLGRRPRRGRI